MMAPGAILGLKSSLNLGLPDNLKGVYNTYRTKGEFTTVPEQGMGLLDKNTQKFTL